MVAAAPSVRPPVAGIVALSPHGLELIGLSERGTVSVRDGVAALKRLRVPLLFISAMEDPALASTRGLFRAAVARGKQLVVVESPGLDHGTELISEIAPAADRLHRLILKFIRDHTG